MAKVVRGEMAKPLKHGPYHPGLMWPYTCEAPAFAELRRGKRMVRAGLALNDR